MINLYALNNADENGGGNDPGASVSPSAPDPPPSTPDPPPTTPDPPPSAPEPSQPIFPGGNNINQDDQYSFDSGILDESTGGGDPSPNPTSGPTPVPSDDPPTVLSPDPIHPDPPPTSDPYPSPETWVPSAPVFPGGNNILQDETDLVDRLGNSPFREILESQQHFTDRENLNLGLSTEGYSSFAETVKNMEIVSTMDHNTSWVEGAGDQHHHNSFNSGESGIHLIQDDSILFNDDYGMRDSYEHTSQSDLLNDGMFEANDLSL